METDPTAADLQTRTWKVAADSVNKRLDVFLASQIEGWSRARLQRLIENEDVLVNGKAAKASYKLKLEDEIEVELVSEPADNFIPENIPLEIIFEDDTVIVINKPSGLVVHPAAGIHSGTLANALAYHFKNLPATDQPLRPGIVHRLDRDTSGLMVVAKTNEALEHLSDQFRDRSVFKSYVGLVHGNIKENAGRIDQPIARDPSNRTRMAVVRSGRSALSIFRVRQRYQRFTLLDVEIKTGRTHQIRVHLAWLKYPVVADETYGGGRDNMIPDPVVRSRVKNLGRQFLHAEKLSFTHPLTGARLEFTSQMPPELQNFLEFLENKDNQ
ncbi:MAG TPA: RluA family pseudouridine synthase [Pyrinomonadaceae bacterium]|nr:RluA family pseudouridine synthase [Pyrinomonadaceae bacterium]